MSAWTHGAAAAGSSSCNAPSKRPVYRREERIDHDPATREFGLWPTVQHTKMGSVRVDGLPVRFSETPWSIERGGPCVGEHTEEVLGSLLGLSSDEVAALRKAGVV